MTTAQPGSLRGPGSRPWQVPFGAVGVRGAGLIVPRFSPPPCLRSVLWVNWREPWQGREGDTIMWLRETQPCWEGAQAQAASAPRHPSLHPRWEEVQGRPCPVPLS